MRIAALAVVAFLLNVGPACADSVPQWILRGRTVVVEHLTIPASEYKSDDDPDTVEMVQITKPEDGESRISEDGEVIFLRRETPQRVILSLLARSMAIRQKAFEARSRAAEAAPAAK